jgi:hypothetical protein
MSSTGAIQSGCWVCLDDIHKVERSVISVAAQLIASVFTVKKEHKQTVHLANLDAIDVNPEFGIFMTQVSQFEVDREAYQRFSWSK